MITELLAALTAYACSPTAAKLSRTFDDHLKDAGQVFVATVTGPQRKGGTKNEEVVPIRILHSFKGDAKGEGLYAQARGGTCGYALEEGVTYLILAGKDGDVFTANAFSGTGELGDKGKELALLAKKPAPKPLPEAHANCRVRVSAEERKACAGQQREFLGRALGLDWLK